MPWSRKRSSRSTSARCRGPSLWSSPWYSPELGTNIAMGHVPVSLTELGTQLWVHLPDEYAETPGKSVRAEVVEMPFRPSVNPNQRERLKAKGLDAAV